MVSVSVGSLNAADFRDESDPELVSTADVPEASLEMVEFFGVVRDARETMSLRRVT